MSAIEKSRTGSETSGNSRKTSTPWRADGSFKMVVFQVRSADRVFREGSGGDDFGKHAVTSFLTWDGLHKALAPKRIALIRLMLGSEPLTIRELARRSGRDFKGVHTDVSWLIREHVIDKTEDGRVVFPHDAFRVDYTSPEDDQ